MPASADAENSPRRLTSWKRARWWGDIRDWCGCTYCKLSEQHLTDTDITQWYNATKERLVSLCRHFTVTSLRWTVSGQIKVHIMQTCTNERGLTQSPSYDCGQHQTMNHIVDTRPLTQLEGGLNLLHDADDDTVIWLESTATAALAKWMNSHEKEEVGLQTCTEDWYRGCQSDVMRQTVSGTSSSNRKCSVTDDGKARVTDDQWLIDWYKV